VTTTTTYPGTWGDVTRTGGLVWTTAEGVVTATSGLAAWELRAPEPLLYLRADDGADGIVLIGQGHDSGHAHLWTATRGWADLGKTHGAFCCETDGVVVWWQTSPTTYSRMTLDTGDIFHGLVPTDPSGTSQGFLDCTAPALLWTDTARIVNGLMLPQAAGAWLVGQHPTEDAILAQAGGIERVVLRRPGLFEPRAAKVGTELIVLIRASDGLVVVRGDPATWPVYTPPTDPPVDPPVEPSPMQTPAHLIEAMVWGGQQADRHHPGLRQSDSDAWMQHAASYAASRYGSIGRKARAPGARVSPDTMASTLGASGMYCVSIIRDNPPVNEWRDTPLDYGIITGQTFVPVMPQTPGGTVPPPVEPPPASDLEARVAKLEARVNRHLQA
jgi:hypothetical protein